MNLMNLIIENILRYFHYYYNYYISKSRNIYWKSRNI